jgi:hypothetical protein
MANRIEPIIGYLIGAYVLLGNRLAVAVKPGAIVNSVQAMEYARRVIAGIFNRNSYQLVITSGIDSVHMAGSLHYTGRAEDYRTRDIHPADLSRMVAEIRSALGSDYDVIIEPDHLHVEYDPN